MTVQNMILYKATIGFEHNTRHHPFTHAFNKTILSRRLHDIAHFSHRRCNIRVSSDIVCESWSWGHLFVLNWILPSRIIPHREDIDV